MINKIKQEKINEILHTINITDATQLAFLVESNLLEEAYDLLKEKLSESDLKELFKLLGGK